MHKTGTGKDACQCPYCDTPMAEAQPFRTGCLTKLRFCGECGKPIPRFAQVCPECGARKPESIGQRKAN